MLKLAVNKVRPMRGFAHFFHLTFVALLPPVVFVLVRLDNFDGVALAVILLSKWRMFAVRPHHWTANLRSNAVDIIVGVSVLICMSSIQAFSWQLVWLALYEVWLLVIKPRSGVAWVSLQAVLAQFLGLSAVFLAFPEAPLVSYVVMFWIITYASARHFLASFDETQARLLASIWAFFGGSLMWVLGHWLLFIGQVAQPALLLAVLGYGLAGLYYLDQTDRLSKLVRRQIIIVMFTIVLIMIVFSDWGDKAI